MGAENEKEMNEKNEIETKKKTSNIPPKKNNQEGNNSKLISSEKIIKTDELNIKTKNKNLFESNKVSGKNNNILINYKEEEKPKNILTETKTKIKFLTKDNTEIENKNEKENKKEPQDKNIISPKRQISTSLIPLLLNKYQSMKEIKSNSNINAYSVKFEIILKEIIPKNNQEYEIITSRLANLKYEIKIYDIFEENKKIYIVIDKENDLELDNLLNPNEIKEKIIIGQGNPIKKSEINELFKMENSVCKIIYERLENKKIEQGNGSGFFCHFQNDFPIKYCLFTNNHVLNDSNLKIGQAITLNYLQDNKMIQKQIKINEKRKVFTGDEIELDYTCIELFESDGIDNFLEIDPIIYDYSNESIKNVNIFVLHYFENEISFSYGKIIGIDICKNKIEHNASTLPGSSGSPIIRRSIISNKYVFALHIGSKKNNNFNLGLPFNSILNDIKNKIKLIKSNNYINCVYINEDNENEFKLLRDLNENYLEEEEEAYNEAKKNIKLFEENIDLYIDGQKMKFTFKYTTDKKEINVKFLFKTKLTNLSYMFLHCSSLNSIDLSSFDTSNVNNMSHMFAGCSSLESLDLSSFVTSNVKNMKAMFQNCFSLKSINLSSFDTSNVNDMSKMFMACSSLKTLDLSSFITNNVKNMEFMFNCCTELESLDLSKFNTSNVKNMDLMFFLCLSLNEGKVKCLDIQILLYLVETMKIFKKNKSKEDEKKEEKDKNKEEKFEKEDEKDEK